MLTFDDVDGGVGTLAWWFRWVYFSEQDVPGESEEDTSERDGQCWIAR